ncbi:unnamed protein product [Haemonchus placei]|uniref:G_PROTEIN_RECEP_F1_2 domain-containing protein n=1 Tax=Haemonchus placei TaxID=6290 RepID=A0A0N4WHF5_HAEPC|nr:unnamed protein product [Haemonchus placei]
MDTERKDEIVAGVIMLIISAFGNVVNIAVVILLYRTPSFHNAFGLICASHLIADIGVLLIFSFWAAPAALLSVFSVRKTKVILAVFWIVSAANVFAYFWSMFAKYFSFFPDREYFHLVSIDRFGQCCSNFTPTLFSRVYDEKGCVQTLTFALAVLSFFVLSKFMESKWGIFVTTTCVWEIAHAVDGNLACNLFINTDTSTTYTASGAIQSGMRSMSAVELRSYQASSMWSYQLCCLYSGPSEGETCRVGYDDIECGLFWVKLAVDVRAFALILYTPVFGLACMMGIPLFILIAFPTFLAERIYNHATLQTDYLSTPEKVLLAFKMVSVFLAGVPVGLFLALNSIITAALVVVMYILFTILKTTPYAKVSKQVAIDRKSNYKQVTRRVTLST